MTTDQAKERLVEKIVGLQGIKATALVSIPEIAVDLQEFDIPDLLDELVGEGKILEIEYNLPEMPERIKSFYLPAGTKVRFVP